MKLNKILTAAGITLALVGTVALAAPASAFGPGGGHGKGFGPGSGGPEADRGQHLADALGISLEELQAARAEAFEAGLTEAVADGRIDQEQADLMLAGHALKQAIDREALMADALGISVEELQAAREEGKSMRELLDELGIEPQALRERMEAAMDAAVEKAVADGVITQEQADALKTAKDERGQGRRGGHRGGVRGGPGGGGFGGLRPGAEGSADETFAPRGLTVPGRDL